MTFPEWVQAVLAIAAERGIIVTIDYPRADWVTFNWHCSNYSQYGSAGAGAEFISLTTPEAFTWLWHCGAAGKIPDPEIIGEPWDRHGRYVPRVPAMAVSDALRALFAVALMDGTAMPGTSGIGIYSSVAGADESAIATETSGGSSGGTPDSSPGKSASAPGQNKDKDKPKGKPS